MSPATRPVIAVAGNGMVGHHFLEAAVERGLHISHRIVVFGEERSAAYDRVHLSTLFDGCSHDDLALAEPGWYERNGIELRLGQRVDGIDTAARRLWTSGSRTSGSRTSGSWTGGGSNLSYDELVLATGSLPFVPPIEGRDAAGCFVYRTTDDVSAIGAWCRAGARRGIVVGGGLLGLEAANALRNLGVATTVVEFAPRLMAVQLDEGGGRALRRHVESLGLAVMTDTAARRVVTTPDGRVEALDVGDDRVPISADVIVFAAGIRPRDQIGRDAGLLIGERGGIVVDDGLRTSDPHISAIGECALHRGRIYGLVAPGYRMAEVLAARLDSGDESPSAGRFEGADTSTKLKLLGVDVAAVGAPPAGGGDEIVFSDPTAGVYKKVVLDGSGRLCSAVLVGDTAAYPTLVQMARGALATPSDPAGLLAPAGSSGATGMSVTDLPDDAVICSCHNVTKGSVCGAVCDGGAPDVAGIKKATKAGTGCGSCVPLLTELLRDELRKAGQEVRNDLCPHFAYSRAELFDIVRVTGVRTFAELIASHGTGRGCEICKPTVASMFASLGHGYVLEGERASLQDTNDHFLANMQKDGTYSVVPRVPGGEITPAQLIAIGEVARDFDLYTKITGGQRIDLFGARVEQLPAIWQRLIAVGFESGHAYGKALRTVKSCVGTSWCRFGVQDAVSMAIRLELRYRGLRAPHKIKSAVSGCARECAEAQSKDFGVIATERGWNLYVCGNGGMRPQHAVLLAEDLDDETLVRYVDRFLMFYIRTADRLERTATWLNKLEGGIDYLRRVVIDDALGIAGDLELDMERHVATYACEWNETLNDPERMARFASFLNSDEPDPDLTYVRVRGQRQPA